MQMGVLPDAFRTFIRSVKPQGIEAADRNHTFNAILEGSGQQSDFAAERVSQKEDFGGVDLLQARERTDSRACVGDHVSDRKSTRLNSSHANISYAVFFLN